MYSLVATITYSERDVSPAVDTCLASYDDYGACVQAVQRRLDQLREFGCIDILLVSLSIMKHTAELEVA